MQFTIEIQCDNDAFGVTDWDAKPEIARILRKYADNLDADGPIDQLLPDSDGNEVGEARLSIADQLSVDSDGNVNARQMIVDNQTVYESLCTKDRRYPMWNDLYGDDEDIPVPRDGCACDNCFNGRDRLAVEILRQRGEAT